MPRDIGMEFFEDEHILLILHADVLNGGKTMQNRGYFLHVFAHGESHQLKLFFFFFQYVEALGADGTGGAQKADFPHAKKFQPCEVKTAKTEAIKRMKTIESARSRMPPWAPRT